MKKGLSILLIAAALFGFYGGAVNLNDVLACKGYWEDKGEQTTADLNKLEDGLNQLKDNEEAYLDGLDAVKDGEEELAKGEQDYADGQAALEEGRATLAQGEADYAAAPAKLAAGKAALAKGEADLADGYDAYEAGEAALEQGKATVAAGEEQLAAAKSQLDQGEEDLAAGKQQVADGEQKLSQLDALIKGLQDVYEGYALGTKNDDVSVPAWKTGFNQLKDGRDRAAKLFTANKSNLDALGAFLPESMQTAYANTVEVLTSDSSKSEEEGKSFEDYDEAMKNMQTFADGILSAIAENKDNVNNAYEQLSSAGDTATNAISQFKTYANNASDYAVKAQTEAEGAEQAQAAAEQAKAAGDAEQAEEYAAKATEHATNAAQAKEAAEQYESGAKKVWAALREGIVEAYKGATGTDMQKAAKLLVTDPKDTSAAQAFGAKIKALAGSIDISKLPASDADLVDIGAYLKSGKLEPFQDKLNDLVGSSAGANLYTINNTINQVSKQANDALPGTKATLAAQEPEFASGIETLSNGQTKLAGGIKQCVAGMLSNEEMKQALLQGASAVKIPSALVYALGTENSPLFTYSLSAFDDKMSVIAPLIKNAILPQLNETKAEGQEALAAGKKAVEEGQAALDAGYAQYNAGQEALAAGKAEVAAGESKLAAAAKQLAAGEKKLAAGRKELAQGLADYKAAPAKLAAGRQQVADGEAALAEGLKKLMDGRSTLAAGKEKLAEYEDGEQQVRDGLATLVATKADGGLTSILERLNGDDNFDDANGHLMLDEGLDAVDVGRGYQADSGELVTKEITNRAIGTAAGLGAGALAVLAAILSFLKKNKGAGVSAILAAAAGAVGTAMGTSAGMEFSSIAGSVVGATPWISFGILAGVALVHAIAHFAGNKAA